MFAASETTSAAVMRSVTEEMYCAAKLNIEKKHKKTVIKNRNRQFSRQFLEKQPINSSIISRAVQGVTSLLNKNLVSASASCVLSHTNGIKISSRESLLNNDIRR